MQNFSRRYLIAPSFVRMLRDQRGYDRAIEGHFPRQPARNSFVHIRTDGADLVLMTGSGSLDEERTAVPRSHAEALLEVCAGAVVYERTRLALREGQEVAIDRFVRPAHLDVATVTFRTAAEQDSFEPPAWLGPEVDESYTPRALALDGTPAFQVVEPSNASLDSLLSALDAGLVRRAADVQAVVETERPPVPARAQARESRAALREAAVAAEPSQTPAPTTPVPDADPAITSLRSIFAAQRSALARQREAVD